MSPSPRYCPGQNTSHVLSKRQQSVSISWAVLETSFITKFVSPSDLLQAYIRPLMEYASPIRNGAGATSLKLSDRLQKKALRLLKIDEPLKFGIVPLSLRRNVASLCVFYSHIFLQPSIELADIIPSEAPSMKATRFSVSGHPYCIHIPRSKTELHLNSYIPRTSRL